MIVPQCLSAIMHRAGLQQLRLSGRVVEVEFPRDDAPERRACIAKG